MINPESTAVLVIDVQNDFCSPDGVMAKKGKNLSYVEETIPQLMRSINQFRDKGMTIIFVKTSHSSLTDSKTWENRGEAAKMVCTSKWGKQLYEVQPEESDIVIVKNRYSAFIGTNLELILQSNDIDSLLFTGFVTNVCIESTVREAFMKDFSTVTLSDCTACYNYDEFKSSLSNLRNYFGDVMLSREVIEVSQ